MNVINMFCNWIEGTLPLSWHGVLAFGLTGAVGFLLGVIVGIWCFISIITSLPAK